MTGKPFPENLILPDAGSAETRRNTKLEKRMESALPIAASLAAILLLTTLLAWWQRSERRDLALLGSLSGIGSAGAAVLWLD